MTSLLLSSREIWSSISSFTLVILLTLSWFFPHGFLAQPQAFAVMGVFFSPLLRADWSMFAEKTMQCDGSGTSGLGLPCPTWQIILCSLLSCPNTPCSLCKESSPCPAAWSGKLSLAWSQPTWSCHRWMESDGEVGLWPGSPYLRPLRRSLLFPGRALPCAWRWGKRQLGVSMACVSVPSSVWPVSLFPLARGCVSQAASACVGPQPPSSPASPHTSLQRGASAG